LVVTLVMDAQQRAQAAEAIESELLRELDEIRKRHTSRPPVNPIAYTHEVECMMWCFDALTDWRDGIAETLQ
jgi:hypothetical protein